MEILVLRAQCVYKWSAGGVVVDQREVEASRQPFRVTARAQGTTRHDLPEKPDECGYGKRTLMRDATGSCDPWASRQGVGEGVTG